MRREPCWTRPKLRHRPGATQEGDPEVLAECPVDGLLESPKARAAGKFYMFTQVEEDGPLQPGRKTPAETGREGLWNAIVATYRAVFSSPVPVHACHNGPAFGKVAQEGHPGSTEVKLQRLHNHAALAFPEEHRWKAVERHLREVHGVKVWSSVYPLL